MRSSVKLSHRLILLLFAALYLVICAVSLPMFLNSGRKIVVMLFALLGAALMVLFGFVRLPKQKNSTVLILCVAYFAILLTAQFCLFQRGFFIGSQDARVLSLLAYDYAVYPPESISLPYFSQYSNNAFLFALLLMLNRVFLAINPALTMEQCTFFLCMVQCALAAATGILSCTVLTRQLRLRRYIAVFCLLYTLFVSFSPWMMIPYSDGFSLLLPVVALCLYLLSRKAGVKCKATSWMAIGLLMGLSMLIKPQAAVMCIAIVIMEAIDLLRPFRWKRLLALVLCIALTAIMVMVPLKQAVLSANRIELDPEQDFGFTHYVMLGMNPETSGQFNQRLYELSAGAPTKAERKQAQLAEINRSLTHYAQNPADIWRVMRDKLLVTFGDGTLCWTGDWVAYECSEPSLSQRFLRVFRDVKAPRWPMVSATETALWLTVLLLALLCPLAAWQHPPLTVLPLSLLGLALFELLFEAGGRYLFGSVPLFLLSAVMALDALAAIIKRKLTPTDNP
ncbi:MAG: hypothetical protein Q4C54_07825 [Clostridia bacterium]|nr:hypothetical protein [Clostridia bacterium]